MAAGRIIDQPVFQSIDRVAGIKHRLVDHGVLGRWNISGGILKAYVRQPQRPRVPPEGCRIAGDDAVELVRIAIGLQKPFSAAARASIPVGVSRVATIKGAENRLCLDGHFMFRAVGEIDELFRMPQHKGAARALVTIVGCAGGVAPAECVGKRLIVNRSAPAAAAHSQKFSIPPGDGEPHLDLDLGVARRPQRGRDTTERRQIRESAAGGKRTGACHLCRCDRGIWQCKLEKACTGLS